MNDVEALILVFKPIAEGVAAGAMFSLIGAAPVLAFGLYGLWRNGAGFSGKSAREAACRNVLGAKNPGPRDAPIADHSDDANTNQEPQHSA